MQKQFTPKWASVIYSLAAALVLAAAGQAQGGILTLKGLTSGSSARLQYDTRNTDGTFDHHVVSAEDGGDINAVGSIFGFPTLTLLGKDALKDGEIVINLGSNEVEATIGTITAIVDPDDPTKETVRKININTKKPDKNGVFQTLASLEPFELPSFLGPALFVIVDLVAFMDEGNSYTDGEVFDVVDGLIAQSSALRFRDYTSPPLGFDPTTEQAEDLPYYNGRVTVGSFMQFKAVPEPASLWLVAIGLLLLGSRGAWSKSKNGRANGDALQAWSP